MLEEDFVYWNFFVCRGQELASFPVLEIPRPPLMWPK